MGKSKKEGRGSDGRGDGDVKAKQQVAFKHKNKPPGKDNFQKSPEEGRQQSDGGKPRQQQGGSRNKRKPSASSVQRADNNAGDGLSKENVTVANGSNQMTGGFDSEYAAEISALEESFKELDSFELQIEQVQPAEMTTSMECTDSPDLKKF